MRHSEWWSLFSTTMHAPSMNTIHGESRTPIRPKPSQHVPWALLGIFSPNKRIPSSLSVVFHLLFHSSPCSSVPTVPLHLLATQIMKETKCYTAGRRLFQVFPWGGEMWPFTSPTRGELNINPQAWCPSPATPSRPSPTTSQDIVWIWTIIYWVASVVISHIWMQRTLQKAMQSVGFSEKHIGVICSQH